MMHQFKLSQTSLGHVNHVTKRRNLPSISVPFLSAVSTETPLLISSVTSPVGTFKGKSAFGDGQNRGYRRYNTVRGKLKRELKNKYEEQMKELRKKYRKEYYEWKAKKDEETAIEFLRWRDRVIEYREKKKQVSLHNIKQQENYEHIVRGEFERRARERHQRKLNEKALISNYRVEMLRNLVRDSKNFITVENLDQHIARELDPTRDVVPTIFYGKFGVNDEVSFAFQKKLRDLRNSLRQDIKGFEKNVPSVLMKLDILLYSMGYDTLANPYMEKLMNYLDKQEENPTPVKPIDIPTHINQDLGIPSNFNFANLQSYQNSDESQAKKQGLETIVDLAFYQHMKRLYQKIPPDENPTSKFIKTRKDPETFSKNLFGSSGTAHTLAKTDEDLVMFKYQNYALDYDPLGKNYIWDPIYPNTVWYHNDAMISRSTYYQMSVRDSQIFGLLHSQEKFENDKKMESLGEAFSQNPSFAFEFADAPKFIKKLRLGKRQHLFKLRVLLDRTREGYETSNEEFSQLLSEYKGPYGDDFDDQELEEDDNEYEDEEEREE